MKKIIFISVVFLTAYLCLVQASAYTYNDVDMQVLLGTTFTNSYSNPISEASSELNRMDYPFNYNFSIYFSYDLAYVDPLPIDDCNLDYNQNCMNSLCGYPCTNFTYNHVHHKNAFKNRTIVDNSVSLGGNDICITLVGTYLCGNDGLFHVGIGGVAELLGDTGLTSNCSTTSFINKVRVIQHEVSHLFGARDGECTPGQLCVMSGGYDNNTSYYSCIWCDQCESRFVQNAH